MPTVELSWNNLLLAMGVVVAIIAVYNTVMSACKTWRAERERKNKPTNDLSEQVAKHTAMLANDKKRMDDMEADIRDIRDGQKYIVQGVQALLDHELHNGNSQQMQDSSDDLGKWLIKKI